MDGDQFATLSELKGLGVRLEVEDFGTGYFSPACLERLPVDSLKVDCSAALGAGRDREGEIIASVTANLAHTLGREAVAERVETGEQLDRLRELGFDRAQGLYLLPVSGREGGVCQQVLTGPVRRLRKPWESEAEAPEDPTTPPPAATARTAALTVLWAASMTQEKRCGCASDFSTFCAPPRDVCEGRPDSI
jgi:EAL domain-containing protein (putative c-di-GMP-specific phosphodiesterase class I)